MKDEDHPIAQGPAQRVIQRHNEEVDEFISEAIREESLLDYYYIKLFLDLGSVGYPAGKAVAWLRGYRFVRDEQEREYRVEKQSRLFSDKRVLDRKSFEEFTGGGLTF